MVKQYSSTFFWLEPLTCCGKYFDLRCLRAGHGKLSTKNKYQSLPSSWSKRKIFSLSERKVISNTCTTKRIKDHFVKIYSGNCIVTISRCNVMWNIYQSLWVLPANYKRNVGKHVHTEVCIICDINIKTPGRDKLWPQKGHHKILKAVKSFS